MKDVQADTLAAPDTQRKGAWTPQEKTLLRHIAPGSPRKARLIELFPGRSLATIKLHLYAARRELDLPKRGKTSNLRPRPMRLTILPKDDEGLAAPCWQERQRPKLERSNSLYLAALARAA